MDRQTFEREMRRARAMARVHDDYRKPYFEGMQRGLRRRYHGENFGSAQEHETWLALSSETRDQSRFWRGIGYRAGLHFGELTIENHDAPMFRQQSRPVADPDGLRSLRRIFGLTVSQVGDMVGVSPRTVEGWEQGRAVPATVLRVLLQLFF